MFARYIGAARRALPCAALAVLVWCMCLSAASAEIKDDAVRALLREALAWIGNHSTFDTNVPPPAVRFVPSDVLYELRQREPAAARTLTEVYANDTIYISDNVALDDPYLSAIIVHALVHYLQEKSGRRYPCIAAMEPEAYRLQIAWMRERGITDNMPDRMTVYLRSHCRLP